MVQSSPHLPRSGWTLYKEQIYWSISSLYHHTQHFYMCLNTNREFNQSRTMTIITKGGVTGVSAGGPGQWPPEGWVWEVKGGACFNSGCWTDQRKVLQRQTRKQRTSSDCRHSGIGRRKKNTSPLLSPPSRSFLLCLSPRITNTSVT